MKIPVFHTIGCECRPADAISLAECKSPPNGPCPCPELHENQIDPKCAQQEAKMKRPDREGEAIHGLCACGSPLYNIGFTGDNRPLLCCDSCYTINPPDPTLTPVKG